MPQDIKTTFDRLGVPDAERKHLAGLGAQYESEVVYHRLKDQWAAKDPDSGLREYRCTS